MNASTWMQLLALALGGGGLGTGFASLVARLTRLAVAVENVVKELGRLQEAASLTAAQVQQHENRLNKAGIP